MSQTTTAGSVAGGGSLDFVQVDIATGVSSLSDVLVAGVDLKDRNGSVYGNAVYGSSSQLKNVVFLNGGAARQGTVVDFVAAGQKLSQLCAILSATPANGTTVAGGGQIQFTGTNPITNVFHVTLADINAASTIIAGVPAGAAAVVVVDGTGQADLRHITFQLGTLQAAKVLWAFCDASRVDLDRVTMTGSIVAPDAEVRFTDATVSGSVAGATLDSQSLTTVTAPFSGCIKPVP